ncbi:hypothetical protein [Candidatus Enterococcus clewellii]|uniref:Uncharacterized protein n=1 Tax=Candidatus Enterococcus clewellii TaxID=1834193 RepID=A0A242K4L6_9ENTE|nr:hypothetical protein [Enterococcus sp. 9E7_DIV0242]OTP14468.1 hypothetical protein A5888_002569 [Enterococcus sp. 9E7_DIV0242]
MNEIKMNEVNMQQFTEDENLQTRGGGLCGFGCTSGGICGLGCKD